MASRTWNGATADWFTVADWTTSGAANFYPTPGDTVAVAAGTIELFGTQAQQNGVFDAVTLGIGASLAAAAPTLLLSNATLGHDFTIDATGNATIDATGTDAIEGTVLANVAGSVVTLATAPPAGAATSELILPYGGAFMVTSGATLDVTGSVLVESGFSIEAASTLINTGTLAVEGATVTIATGAFVSGNGTFEPGYAGSVYFADNLVPTSVTVAFNGVDASLRIGAPVLFLGTIEHFASGDQIDLTTLTANGVYYNSANRTIVATENNVPVAALHVAAPVSGLVAVSDGGAGTDIEFAGQPTSAAYAAAAGDVALQSNIARATLTTTAGAAITGAGVKIGILSDSFNIDGDADDEAAAGYLPMNANGTSAVKVLTEGPAGSGDEGRAMAELIHEIAPGAAIDFTTAADGQIAFANGVAALVADGCNIIVDDWSYFGEPFFQIAGTVDTAITAAITAGVDYFTAAGNDGSAYYQANWTPAAATLPSIAGTVNAMQFSNGSSLQSLTLFGGVTTYITLDWNAPAPTTSNTPDQLVLALYDATGQTLLGVSQQLQASNGLFEGATQLSYTPTTTGNYALAIYQVSGAPAPSEFKYVLYGAGVGSTPGGIINDPAAQNGGGDITGHALIPGVNTVGAIAWSETAPFGNPEIGPEYFSDTGPGTLLYSATGAAETSPVSDGKVDLLAADGVGVAVPGVGAFYGTSAAAPEAAAVAALMLQANPSLTTSQVTQILATTAQPIAGVASALQGAGVIDADLAVTAALQVACYARGTRLRTPRGETAIEELRPGDAIVTANGSIVPVVWIGHRHVDPARHPRPSEIIPIRIAADAVAPGIPSRDLRLSPDHAIAWDGALIPVRHLVNGATIAPDRCAYVTYFHVELPRHDLVLAEGLAAESYLDTGNRYAFANGGDAVMLHPSFAPAMAAAQLWAARACAPHVSDGPTLRAARAALAARAVALGHTTTDNAVLRVIADDVVLHPSSRGASHSFRLPERVTRLRLRSRVWVPADLDPDSRDRRALGVHVWRLSRDGVTLDLDGPGLGAGWHAPDATGRWTDGDAVIAPAGARRLDITLGAAALYWTTRAARHRAA